MGIDTGTGPDVTVVVAVYNTMPYLTACLRSLVTQSIGRRRMHIVAVDDGSTDGSPAELARFARRYPSLFTIVRQENSGGPAVPSNRGLDLATGRYLFFIGADDYLGHEALERLVRAGDEYGADVVAGRMVGTGGRFVPQRVFEQTDTDIDLYNSDLPFAMSNTKLFRREPLVRNGIRYPEDLPIGSDQPFTVAACVHAKRIAVLADYDYYFAVRREDSGNITYRYDHEAKLECTGRIMDAVAELIGAGPQRDAIMIRNFAAELSKLLRSGFRRLERERQEAVCAGIKRLSDAYLTDRIRERLDASRRLRISLAQHGYVDDLIRVIGQNTWKKPLKLVRDGDRLYAGYACFRDERALPDSWFFITDSVGEMMTHQLTVKSVAWRGNRRGGDDLVVTATSPFRPEELEEAHLTARVRGASARISYKPSPTRPVTTVRLAWSLRELMAECPRLGGQLTIEIVTTRNGVTARNPLHLPALLERPRRLGRSGLRGYFVAPVKQADAEFALEYQRASRSEIWESTRLRLVAERRRAARRIRTRLGHTTTT